MSIRFNTQIRIFLRKFIKPQYGLSLLVISAIQWLLRGVFDEWFFNYLLKVIGGEPMTNYLIYLPILLILAILLKMYFDSKRELKSEIEKSIPNLLWKMHRRLMQLAETRAKEKVDTEKFQTANLLIADSTGVVKLEEQDKVMSDMKKELGISRLPKSAKGKKKLSKKLLHLSKEYEAKFKDRDKEWGLADLIKIGENLDGQKMGIGDLRDRDNWKWKRWYKKMNLEKDKYHDDELDKLVSENIFVSYGCCSEWLHSVYLLKISNEYIELTLSRLRGATANMLINIDIAMERKTLAIINRIKELRSKENNNDH